MNVKKKYLKSVAEDDARYGKYGLTHADGTPCDAKTPESCPHNKNAQKADDLSGAKKKDSSEEYDVDWIDEDDPVKKAEKKARHDLRNRAGWISSILDDALRAFDDETAHAYATAPCDSEALSMWSARSDRQKNLADQDANLREEYVELIDRIKDFRDRAKKLRTV